MGPWETYAAARRLTAPPPPRPVTVGDIQRRLYPGQAGFAADLSSRARADVDALTGVIDRVKADPTSWPNLFPAVANYVPNAFGLLPAAAMDQLTRPAVGAVNARFGTHYDPQYVTDQLLTAAGLIAGGGEGPPRAPVRSAARSTSRWMGLRPDGAYPEADSTVTAPPSPTPRPGGGAPARVPEPAEPALRPGVARQLQLPSPAAQSLAPPLAADAGSVTDRLAAVPQHLTVAPDDIFATRDWLQQERLKLMSPENQRQFHENARETVMAPFLDDPDSPGLTGEDLSRVRSTLAALADHYVGQGADGKFMADEIGHLTDNVMSLAARTHPEFAEALGGPRPWKPQAILGMGDAGTQTPVMMDPDMWSLLPPGRNNHMELTRGPDGNDWLTPNTDALRGGGGGGDGATPPAASPWPPSWWPDDVAPASSGGDAEQLSPSQAAAIRFWASADDRWKGLAAQEIRRFLNGGVPGGPPPGVAPGTSRPPVLSIVGKDTNAFTGAPATNPTPPDD